jgi:outer membrane protein OmpA-like peptidoglycan-associated protein
MATGQVTVTDAEAMAAGIDATGKIALDNIYFGFGSATLLAGSDPAIAEIARLLSDRPEPQVYLVGPTGCVGTLEAELTQSRDRAQAVADVLEGRFGVAAVPAGVGPLAPVASIATEEGRALNRRVAIVAR